MIRGFAEQIKFDMNWSKYSDEQLKACASGCMKQTAYFIILLVSIIWLSGCKTKEFVYVNTTDTLVVHKTDTVKDIKIKWQKKDSIVHDSVIVKQDSSGKPVEIHHWHTERVTDIQRDSVDKYKAKCDSLTQKVKEAEKKKKVITKTNYSGWWAFGGLLLACALIVFLLIRFKPK